MSSSPPVRIPESQLAFEQLSIRGCLNPPKMILHVQTQRRSQKHAGPRKEGRIVEIDHAADDRTQGTWQLTAERRERFEQRESGERIEPHT